jgi:photosystem II stability/assembly factor-like uncharacterized protein
VGDEVLSEPAPILWVSLDGPGHGEILSTFASTEGTLYAGTSGALCRSIDRGNGWDCDDAFSGVQSWAEHYKWTWVATAEGVFESTTAGRSWRIVAEADTAGGPFETLLYTGCCTFAGRRSPEGTVLYRSGSGDTWNLISDGAAFTRIRSLLSCTFETILAGGDGGVLRTTDYGETWTAINRGLVAGGEVPVVHDIVRDPFDRLYAATQSGGVFRSHDGGDSWEPSGLSELTVLSLATNSIGHVFAGTVSGVYRLTGDRASWEMVGLEGYEISLLAIDQKERILAATEDVLHRSKDSTIRRP